MYRTTGLRLILAAFTAVISLGAQMGIAEVPRRPRPTQLLGGYFISRDGAFRLFGQGLRARFDASGVHLAVNPEEVSISLDGSDPLAQLEGRDPLPVRIGFLGLTGLARVPAWQTVVYRETYPRIDLYYRIEGSNLKSVFAVRPGGDPRRIRIRYGSDSRLRVADDGSLVAETPNARICDSPPQIYQEMDGRRRPVEGGYRLFADGTVGFWLGQFDPDRPLTIDPVLTFSTYLGGSTQDAATAVSVDGSGNIYVAGWSASTDLPVSNAVQGHMGGAVDAFVAKISAAGTLVYCTYFGGSGDDRAFGVAVDSANNVYVTGWTYSADFPLAGHPVSNRLSGGRDAFILKLNSSGTALVYSTYLGGSSNDAGRSIAVDAYGNCYVAGETSSSDFPVVSAVQSKSGGQQDGFVVKLNSQGSVLQYSTYLGGIGSDNVAALAIDASGAAYVTGGTNSPDFPVQGPFQPKLSGGQDGFVAKLAPSGAALIYSSYLGGSGGSVTIAECGYGIDVDTSGNAYVTGVTSSSDFPVAGPFQSTLHGGVDAFVTKVNAAGNALVFSTYLGGSSIDLGTAVRVSSSGQVYVSGFTYSADFPLMNSVQSGAGGDYDGFVAEMNSAGSGLVFSTLLGGFGSDSCNALAIDYAGNIYVVGQTSSYNFQTRAPIQGTLKGISNAFGLRLAIGNRSGTLTANSPIQVCDQSGLAAATLSWSTYGVGAISLRVNAPDGAPFSPVGPPSGTATTGKWVADGTTFYLQDTSAGLPLTAANTLSTATVHLTTAGCSVRTGSLTVTPDPVQVCDGSGLATVTLSWTSTGTQAVSVRLGSPSGVGVPEKAPSNGQQVTGNWVPEGTVFFLQDISGGLPLTANNTLATATAHLTTAGCPATRSATLTVNPTPAMVCDGSGLAVVTLSWTTSGTQATSVRIGSPNGVGVPEQGPSVGQQVTGKWVPEGTVFYLQDISGGRPLTAANTLATATAHLTTAGCSIARSGTLSVTPSPARVCDGSGLAAVTLSWTSVGTQLTSVRIGSASGVGVPDKGPPQGQQVTGKWVPDGTVFYLQDISGGLPLNPTNTLATAVARVTGAGCPTF